MLQVFSFLLPMGSTNGSVFVSSSAPFGKLTSVDCALPNRPLVLFRPPKVLPSPFRDFFSLTPPRLQLSLLKGANVMVFMECIRACLCVRVCSYMAVYVRVHCTSLSYCLSPVHCAPSGFLATSFIDNIDVLRGAERRRPSERECQQEQHLRGDGTWHKPEYMLPISSQGSTPMLPRA